MTLTHRKLLEQVYRRHRLASIYSGHVPLTVEQFMSEITVEELSE